MFFWGVLGLFGVVCDDLAFVLRLGFPCVTLVCSPTTNQNVLKWYFKVAQFWGAHRLPVVRKYDRLFYSYVDVRTVTDFI